MLKTPNFRLYSQLLGAALLAVSFSYNVIADSSEQTTAYHKEIDEVIKGEEYKELNTALKYCDRELLGNYVMESGASFDEKLSADQIKKCQNIASHVKYLSSVNLDWYEPVSGETIGDKGPKISQTQNEINSRCCKGNKICEITDIDNNCNVLDNSTQSLESGFSDLASLLIQADPGKLENNKFDFKVGTEGFCDKCYKGAFEKVLGGKDYDGERKKLQAKLNEKLLEKRVNRLFDDASFFTSKILSILELHPAAAEEIKKHYDKNGDDLRENNNFYTGIPSCLQYDSIEKMVSAGTLGCMDQKPELMKKRLAKIYKGQFGEDLDPNKDVAELIKDLGNKHYNKILSAQSKVCPVNLSDEKAALNKVGMGAYSSHNFTKMWGNKNFSNTFIGILTELKRNEGLNKKIKEYCTTTEADIYPKEFIVNELLANYDFSSSPSERFSEKTKAYMRTRGILNGDKAKLDLFLKSSMMLDNGAYEMLTDESSFCFFATDEKEWQNPEDIKESLHRTRDRVLHKDGSKEKISWAIDGVNNQIRNIISPCADINTKLVEAICSPEEGLSPGAIADLDQDDINEAGKEVLSELSGTDSEKRQKSLLLESAACSVAGKNNNGAIAELKKNSVDSKIIKDMGDFAQSETGKKFTQEHFFEKEKSMCDLNNRQSAFVFSRLEMGEKFTGAYYIPKVLTEPKLPNSDELLVVSSRAVTESALRATSGSGDVVQGQQGAGIVNKTAPTPSARDNSKGKSSSAANIGSGEQADRGVVTGVEDLTVSKQKGAGGILPGNDGVPLVAKSSDIVTADRTTTAIKPNKFAQQVQASEVAYNNSSYQARIADDMKSYVPPAMRAGDTDKVLVQNGEINEEFDEVAGKAAEANISEDELKGLIDGTAAAEKAVMDKIENSDELSSKEKADLLAQIESLENQVKASHDSSAKKTEADKRIAELEAEVERLKFLSTSTQSRSPAGSLNASSSQAGGAGGDSQRTSIGGTSSGKLNTFKTGVGYVANAPIAQPDLGTKALSNSLKGSIGQAFNQGKAKFQFQSGTEGSNGLYLIAEGRKMAVDLEDIIVDDSGKVAQIVLFNKPINASDFKDKTSLAELQKFVDENKGLISQNADARIKDAQQAIVGLQEISSFHDKVAKGDTDGVRYTEFLKEYTDVD